MKKILSIVLVCLMVCTVFAGGKKEAAKDSHVIDELVIEFVPSVDIEKTTAQTAPLAGLLQAQLAKQGWTVNNIKVTVGTNYEATGEALGAGSCDIGFLPAGTYVTFDDAAEVILTATRYGKSVESDDPAVWNKREPITNVTDNKVVGYRSLIYVGPSAKGQELAAKVNAGQALTWDDVNSANWGVSSATSSAGYVYPSIWLNERYGKTVADLKHAIQTTGYAAAFAGLASGMYDVVVSYADARIDYEDEWVSEWGRTASIWDEVDLIGVTDYIYNDTISVSRDAEKMTPEFKAALQDAFIAIADTPEGQEVFSIYSHLGYMKAVDADYDTARAANALLHK